MAGPAPLSPTPGDGAADVVFAALADPTRRHLVEMLAAEPGATATSLASALPISRQAVAKHLTMLDHAGLVHSRRRGRELRFELEPRPLADAAAWMAAVGAEWDDHLERLRRLLEH